MGDARNRFVANPIKRYSVSDRSGLLSNADGSVDIYIQNTAPAGHQSNWLPAPTDPSNNTIFAYVGKRTTGTEASEYLVSGPGWKATI